jgi:6-phosphofructokinase 1
MEKVYFFGASLAITLVGHYVNLKRKSELEKKVENFKSSPAVVHEKPLFLGNINDDLEHFPLDHLRELYPKMSEDHSFPSPLLSRTWPVNQNFVNTDEEVITCQTMHPHTNITPRKARAFRAAGPFENLYWDSKKSKAMIVTCGGLCPGLNTVIREIVMCLTFVYGFQKGQIYGAKNGYRGLYDPSSYLELTPVVVGPIHQLGGTILGSSRGGFDATKILNTLEEQGFNLLFVIGGDGTHRGILELVSSSIGRKLPISIIGVPKTIDNDIDFIDKSFGFDTAVSLAMNPLNCAHVEAIAAQNGIGIVKVMGRSSGFIALFASLASRDVNITLLPEAPWRMSKLLAYLEGRLQKKGHCLILVAEGAESIEEKERKAAKAAAGEDFVKRDESGNQVLDDVGVYLRDKIVAHFKENTKMPVNVKYIDPSYIIRSSPANASDSHMCTSLAFNAAHAAMAGYTGVTIGQIDNAFVLLPIKLIASQPPRKVDPLGRFYARMCNVTGQPKLE